MPRHSLKSRSSRGFFPHSRAPSLLFFAKQFPLLLQLILIAPMSSTGAFGGAGARVPSGSGGRKRGRPFESRNKAKVPVVTLLVPRRCGRPPGSCNKRTLEALAAAAATESAGVASATAVTAAPAGVVALATTNAAAPAGATSVAGLCRWISCCKNTGYHATDPKIRTQGAERGRSWIATKHGDRSLESSNAQHAAERDVELYPGLGPSW
jgi:hypothetical protein